MFALVLALFIGTFLPNINCQTVPRRGTVRLVRGTAVSSSYTSGRVQIYINSRWGHICDDSDFGMTEATVICHQLGYSSASSYSRRGLDDTFGLDFTVSYSLDNVDCSSSSSYLVILQCSHSTSINTGCIPNNDEVSVTCMSTRIWNSPYDAQIRLTGAQYTNQGLVEVYCNGQWGTICDYQFGSSDANTVCRQQGYTGAARYDSLSLTGSSSQPIWFTNVPCITTYSCLRTCRQCRTSAVTSCSHSEDVTVECEFSLGGFSSTQTDTCDFGTTSPPFELNVVGLIVGITVVGLVCTFLPFLIPVCICCCLGVGVFGATRSRRSGPSTRIVASTAPPPVPPATAVVTTTEFNEKANYPTGAYPTQQPYPTQPPPPAYAAQPPAAYPAQPPAAYPVQPQDGYPPPHVPDGGYPPQPYPPTTEQAEPPPYGGAAYPPAAPYP